MDTLAKTATDPFSTEAQQDEGVEPYDESGEQYEGEEPTSEGLGEAAGAAFGANLDGLSGTQEELDGTDYLKVRFVGMAMDSLEDEIALGDELTFIVRARCVGEGTDLAKTDGHRRRFVKMDVSSVVIKEDTK